jgi:hypothetical protein
VPSLYVGTGATSAGANVAGGRGAPVVVIENLHVSTELDVEAFMKRVAWVAQTSGL